MKKVKTGVLLLACILMVVGSFFLMLPVKQDSMLTPSLPSSTPAATATPAPIELSSPMPTQVVDERTRHKSSTIYRGSERVEDLGVYVATAYTDSYEDCGKNDGITKSGVKVQPGVTVAVDPRYIKLFSRLYIEDRDGNPIRVKAVAHDIGGAIKGKKLDIYMTSKKACTQWGRRKVKVYKYVD